MNSASYFLINSLNTGGAERQASLILSHIKFKKTFLLENRIDFEIKKQQNFVTLGNRFYSILGPASKLLSLPWLGIKLAQSIEESSKVLSFLEISNYINILSAILFKKHKSMISLRTIPSMQYKAFSGMVHKLLIKLLYPHASVIVCNTLGAKEDLIRNFFIPPEKVVVIPNGYDLEDIQDQAAKQTHLDQYLKERDAICYVARLTYGKAHIELLSVFREVKFKNPKAVLVLLGDGPMKERIYGECKRLNLSVWNYNESRFPEKDQDILFLGFQNNPYSFVSKSKVFVSPSKWEGLPNAIIESLICKTPVISSDCPTGPREVLISIDVPEAGILLPTFKSDFSLSTSELQLWSKSILSLLCDRSKVDTLQENGLKRSQDFSKQRVLKDWEYILSWLSAK